MKILWGEVTNLSNDSRKNYRNGWVTPSGMFYLEHEGINNIGKIPLAVQNVWGSPYRAGRASEGFTWEYKFYNL